MHHPLEARNRSVLARTTNHEYDANLLQSLVIHDRFPGRRASLVFLFSTYFTNQWINGGVTESMEHILVNCQATPRRQIWSMAREIWPHEQSAWPEINIGTILGCGILSPPTNNQRDPNERENERENERGNTPKQIQGKTRLLQILISESAHLIWALRCERVIANPDHRHSEREIRSRWLRAINLRLTEDKLTATKIKRDKKTKQIVRDTWEPVLRQSLPITNDWLYHREVLVGRST